MNPLYVIFCWQTELLALAASLVTQLAKMQIDWFLAGRMASLRASLRSGADLRRQHPVLNQFLLPVLPIFAGVLLAVIVPIPPVLKQFLGAHPSRPRELTSIAAWGAIGGLLGDYFYSRIHQARRAIRAQRAG